MNNYGVQTITRRPLIRTTQEQMSKERNQQLQRNIDALSSPPQICVKIMPVLPKIEHQEIQLSHVTSVMCLKSLMYPRISKSQDVLLTTVCVVVLWERGR